MCLGQVEIVPMSWQGRLNTELTDGPVSHSGKLYRILQVYIFLNLNSIFVNIVKMTILLKNKIFNLIKSRFSTFFVRSFCLS